MHSPEVEFNKIFLPKFLNRIALAPLDIPPDTKNTIPPDTKNMVFLVSMGMSKGSRPFWPW